MCDFRLLSPLKSRSISNRVSGNGTAECRYRTRTRRLCSAPDSTFDRVQWGRRTYFRAPRPASIAENHDEHARPSGRRSFEMFAARVWTVPLPGLHLLWKHTRQRPSRRGRAMKIAFSNLTEYESSRRLLNTRKINYTIKNWIQWFHHDILHTILIHNSKRP